MKKILVVAPSSYPVFGAEAIVNIKLLKALSKSHDFGIDLISKKSKWSDYPSDTLEDLGVKLNSISIEEVGNNISLKTVWLHIKSLFIFGAIFKGCHWAVKVLPHIKFLLNHNKYDYILTKNAPSLLIGHYIKRKYGIRWIATWNDPYPVIKYPVPYGKGCDAKLNILDKLQLRIMEHADIHVFPNIRIRDYMLKYLKTRYEQTIIIPHIVNNANTGSNNRLSSKVRLKLIHSGNILPPRDPHNLIDAINSLDEEIIKNLSITILGVNNTADFAIANNKFDVFHFHPPVTYSESITALKDYDIAMIIEAPCDEGIFLPTKVSDFMQNNIPIWALSPKNGVLNDLHRNGNIPYFSDISDPSSIKDTIVSIYKDFQSKCIRQNVVPIEYTEDYIVRQYKDL